MALLKNTGGAVALFLAVITIQATVLAPYPAQAQQPEGHCFPYAGPACDSRHCMAVCLAHGFVNPKARCSGHRPGGEGCCCADGLAERVV